MPDAAPVDLSQRRRIHVIGAGGSGMSAIAGVLLGMGHSVTGTDTADSAALRRVGSAGGEVRTGHHPEWAQAADAVARSTAVGDDDPEVRAAITAGVPVLRRAEILAAICARKRTIAVSGTHGKTTTSAMTAVTLDQLGLRPSMIVGGEIAGVGSGYRWDPEGEWLVVEADESDGTFLQLAAEAVVVTSVEADHLEYYGSMEALTAAFHRFVSAAPGPAVVCADDSGAAALASTPRTGRPTLTYGTTPGSMVRIGDVRLHREGASFALSGPAVGTEVPVQILVPGLHNVRNATAAITVAVGIGASWHDAAGAVRHFCGVGRRFEAKGSVGGVDFVDGYDHLPTEVAAAVATAATGGWDRVVVAFQPHRYSRTQALWEAFADAFTKAAVVVLTGIYPAGESPREGVTGRLIEKAVASSHPEADVRYAETLDEAAAVLAELLRPGDICLTLGAGDVTTLAERVMRIMRQEG